MVRRLLAATTLCLLLAPLAHTAPITLNPGESALFNFDLTGVIPGPVYGEVTIETNLADYEGDELGHWNFYDEFAPPLGTFIGSGALNDPLLVTNIGGVVDGIFALQIVLLAGSGSSVTVNPYITGVTTVDGQQVALDIPPVGVPEPGAVPLLCLALGLMAVGCRRELRVRQHRAPVRGYTRRA